MTEDFTVKQAGFEGPLELLLSLIEKRKLPINDVSLASVTDDYIQYIENRGEFSLTQTSHFVLIASTLLLIKSKSLLPTLELTEEEEEDIEDLERRLILYKQIKDLSVAVRQMFGTHILFELRQHKTKTIVFSPSKDITQKTLCESVENVIRSLPKVTLNPEATIRKVVSLEEMIESLTERIGKSLRLSFTDFSQIGKREKVEVIVSFLAMLELVKQGIINAEQQEQFADITMETDTVGVPQYE